MIKRPMFMFGGDNFPSGLSLSKPQQSWKDKVKNRYTVLVDRLTSLEVVRHDLEAQGARILHQFNVLHGFILEANPAIVLNVAEVPTVRSFEPTYEPRALHGDIDTSLRWNCF